MKKVAKVNLARRAFVGKTK